MWMELEILEMGYARESSLFRHSQPCSCAPTNTCQATQDLLEERSRLYMALRTIKEMTSMIMHIDGSSGEDGAAPLPAEDSIVSRHELSSAECLTTAVARKPCAEAYLVRERGERVGVLGTPG